MRKRIRVLGYCAFVAGWSWLSAARADTVVASTPPPATVVVPADTPRTVGPNTALITSGFITFGVPYVTSIIIASQSQHQGDKSLYVPVAGPWFDLGNRGACDGPSQPTCATETGYKVLLVADGLLQTVGAVEVLAGLLIPSRETTVVAGETPHVRIAPAPMASGGAGLVALGTF